ncbi:hypothetical protein [Lentibacillus sp. CBA3610]|uniref:hypothetical protein n=1 Tax=Lentibacillus sp. CBA3610 TaxID=2518176 RepID=UPI0015956F0E|nr:hypothetical protein [Lentibacillus sp. CBA3610]QKY70551.1 hypothetical protein Len3610_13985 [Lentibacillus sp. CBA3610]
MNDGKFNIKLNKDLTGVSDFNLVNRQVNSQMKRLEEDMNRINEDKARKEQEAIQRDKERTKYARQTAENTRHIPEMINLIREGNEINREALELYKEMLNVIKAATEEEAKGMVNDIAEKAKNANENVSTVVSLYNYGRALIKTMSDMNMFG